MIAETDVCVIGGGPAGATVAARLAHLGHRVSVVERAAPPMARSAASLPATILPLLEYIGARNRIERAGFIRSRRTIIWWSGGAPVVREDPDPPGLHVDRASFDRLLLDHARNEGVSVLPGTAFRPSRASDGWSTRLRLGADSCDLRSKIVVDATGSTNLVPGRRHSMAPPLVAMSAEWSNADGGVEGRVEAGDNEWFWCAPTSKQSVMVTAFLDPHRLAGLPRLGVERVYDDLAGRFRLFRRKGPSRRESHVAICDASSNYAEKPAGADYVKAGDAAFKLDPLSSQGVQSAVATGIQASIIVNTLLCRPENTNAAVEFYTLNQTHLVRKHASASAGFYAERAAVCELPFWTRRAAVAADIAKSGEPAGVSPLDCDCRIQLNGAATVGAVPAAQGNLIELVPGVFHAMLDRPVVFVGTIQVVTLLRQMLPGDTVRTLTERWAQSMPLDLAWQIAAFLWEKQVLVHSVATRLDLAADACPIRASPSTRGDL